MAKDDGLVLRGDRWWYDFRYHGQRYAKSVGTKTDAINALRKLRGELVSGHLLHEHGINHGKVKAMTVERFFRDEYSPWLDANRSALTARNDKFVIERFVKSCGRRPLDLPPVAFDDYKRSRKDVADVTLAYDLQRLRAFFNLAVERGYLRQHPMAKVKIPKAEERVPQVLEPEKEACLWAALPTETARHLFRFAFFTCLRRHEALTLRWQDIQLDKAEPQLSIRQEKTKKVKTLPLVPEALAILKAIRPEPANPDGYVFTTRDGKPIAEQTWADWWCAARRQCKLPEGLRPHDLRGTLAHRLDVAGTPLPVIGQILGHAAPYRATVKYLQFFKAEQVKKALVGVFKK